MSRKALLNSTAGSIARNKDGNTAMFFALALVPMSMVMGFALDYSHLTNAKAEGQIAMDAAVLSAAKTYVESYGEKEAKRRTLARKAGDKTYFENITNKKDNVRFGKRTYTFDADGRVTGSVEMNTDAVFTRIMGKKKLRAGVESQAMAGDGRPFEIVLVLDNTSSMFQNDRMDNMRKSAKLFSEIMYSSSPNPEMTRISIIPTASLVNINVERPSAWQSADNGFKGTADPGPDGSRKTPKPAFENRLKYLRHPDTDMSMTQSELDDMFAPVEWRGCVRVADNERKVSSSGLVQGKLTDMPPSSGMRWRAAWVKPEIDYTYVNEAPPPPPPPPSVPPVQGSLELPVYDVWKPQVREVAGAYFQGLVPECPASQSTYQHGMEGARNVYVNETQDCSDDWRDRKTGTIQACVSDPNEFEWNSSGKKTCEWQKSTLPWTSHKGISGPNMNCPTAMLGLSESPSQVYNKLDHMYPVPGGTQMDVGLMWGLRAMSPRKQWVDFFGYQSGAEPRAFNDPNTRKIMIVLTDGANLAPYHFEGYYGCKDDDRRNPAGNCWESDDAKDLDTKGLNNLMLDACKSIRDDYGVELYTVAMDISDKTAIKALRDCAGDKSRAYNVESKELRKTFDQLAMRSLRLTK